QSISISDINVVNDKPWTTGDTATLQWGEVSAGIYAHGVNGLTLNRVNITTQGKQGLYLAQTVASVSASTIQAAYMEIVSISATLRATNLKLVQNFSPPIPRLAADRHPMVWTEGNSRLIFDNTAIKFNTGIGFVVSNQTASYPSTCRSSNP